LIVAPDGAAVRLYVSVCPASGSVATAVNVAALPSFTVWFPIADSTGGWFVLVVPPSDTTLRNASPPLAYSAAIQSGIGAAFETRPLPTVPSKSSPPEPDPPIHSCPVPFAAWATPDATAAPFTYSCRVPAVPSCTTAT